MRSEVYARAFTSLFVFAHLVGRIWFYSLSHTVVCDGYEPRGCTRSPHIVRNVRKTKLPSGDDFFQSFFVIGKNRKAGSVDLVIKMSLTEGTAQSFHPHSDEQVIPTGFQHEMMRLCPTGFGHLPGKGIYQPVGVKSGSRQLHHTIKPLRVRSYRVKGHGGGLSTHEGRGQVIPRGLG